MECINVRNFGAAGDGINDDKEAIQTALNTACPTVYIPEGTYRIAGTLKIGSNKCIVAEPSARLFHCPSFPKKRGDFLISNSDPKRGNDHIKIQGGIWDGNYDGNNNTKADNLFDPQASSGATMNFVNVNKLDLLHLEVANSVTYYIRMCRLCDFTIKGISFSAEKLSFNQDGLHFAGGCKNGLVEDIRAITYGETNDDMIALNADDSIRRIENLDLVCDNIENIVFRNIYAENCHTAIRMLSIHNKINNIRFENVTAGCRAYAINMDAARYCRTPLFDEDDFPYGVGCIDRIYINKFNFYSTNSQSRLPLICCETLTDNFIIENMERLLDKDINPNLPLAEIRKVSGMIIHYQYENHSKRIFLNEYTDRHIIKESIRGLSLCRNK